MGKLNDRFVIILDIDSVFSVNEVATLQAHGGPVSSGTLTETK